MSGPGRPDSDDAPPIEVGDKSTQLAKAPDRRDALAETVGAAMATRARAEVEAQFVVAARNPRTWLTVRSKLLEACKRPGFADAAMYEKPIGGNKTIDGLSIRFAEEAMRSMGNMIASSAVAFDDEKERVIKVVVLDLESNTAHAHDVIVEKVVERRNPRQGQEVVSSRKNSSGQVVYLIAASEDELLVKQGAMISKAKRNLIIAQLPGDIQEEAQAQIQATKAQRDATDPAAALKGVCDKFYAIGISPDDLIEYLGHDLKQIRPQELDELRRVGVAIRDGETTWPDALATKNGQRTAKAAKPDEAPKPKAKGTEGLSSALGGKAPNETGK